jgi:hypothetical protein
MFSAKLSFWPKMHIGQKCVPAKTSFWPNIFVPKKRFGQMTLRCDE